MATGYKRSVFVAAKRGEKYRSGKGRPPRSRFAAQGDGLFSRLDAGGYVGLFCVIQAGIASEAGSQLMLEPLRRKKKIGCLVRSQLL